MIGSYREWRSHKGPSEITAILLRALAMGLFLSGPIVAASEDSTVLFWVVSSRGISQSQLQDPVRAIPQLKVFAADESGRLSPAEPAAAEEAWRDAKALWVGVHGNRMSWASAVSFMREVRCAAGAPPDPMIVWSWPSQVQLRGIARDSRLKATRSMAEASLLAAWLRQLRPRGRLILVGYSFGAKTVLRAVVQSLNGQQTGGGFGGNGQDSPQPAWKPKKLTLVLIAAAADPGELQRAIDAAARQHVALQIVLTLNSRDPALRWYRHLWGCHGPYAIGWALPCLREAPESVVLDELDLSRQVGHTHAWQIYLAAPALQRALRGIVATGNATPPTSAMN